MKDAYGYLNMGLGCTSINQDWLPLAYFRLHVEMLYIARGSYFVQHLLRRVSCDAMTMTSAYKPTDSLHSCVAMFYQHLHSIHVLIVLPI